MTDVENLVLEQLRAIRGSPSDHGDRLSHIELRLSAMEQTLGSICALAGSDRETLDAVIRRIERIERRLGLSEQSTSLPNGNAASAGPRAPDGGTQGPDRLCLARLFHASGDRTGIQAGRQPNGSELD